MKWIKIWTEETVKGTTFTELNAENRGIWFSLIALAGLEGTGLIQAGIGRGYSDVSLADILNIELPQLVEAKEKLIKFKKIKVFPEGIIEILNWTKYQDEYHRQKPYRVTKKEIHKKHKELQEGLQDELQQKLPAEKEEDKDKNKKKNKKRKTPLSTEDFLKKIRKMPAYSHINIDLELNKMDVWLLKNPGIQKSSKFIMNWLNKIEIPMQPTKTSGGFNNYGSKHIPEA